MRNSFQPFLTFLCLCLLATPVRAQPKERPPAAVELAPVVEGTYNQTVELVGTTLPRQRSTVAGQAGGAVLHTLVDEGDRVEAGTPLAVLESEGLVIDIQTAEAAVAELNARYTEQRDKLKRARNLHQRGHISDEEYAEAQQAEIALKNGVVRTEGAVRRLKDQLKKKTILAPYDGVVSRKHITVGEWLDEGGAAFEVLDLSHVRVLVDLPEKFFSVLQPAGKAGVTLEAFPGETFTGGIMAIIPDADPQSHTLPVKVEIANPDGRLTAGMFARVRLELGTTAKGILVPKDALVARGASFMVYVEVNGTAQPVMVQRLRDVEDKAVVTGDLQAGQQVVVRGNERLQPGQPLRAAGTSSARTPAAGNPDGG